MKHLVKTLHDDQENFRDAAEHVRDSDLKVLFMDFSTERARFLGGLQNEIERLGKRRPGNAASRRAENSAFDFRLLAQS